MSVMLWEKWDAERSEEARGNRSPGMRDCHSGQDRGQSQDGDAHLVNVADRDNVSYFVAMKMYPLVIC